MNCLRNAVWGFIVLFYTLGVSGLTIYSHYCAGNLKQISLQAISCCCADDEQENLPNAISEEDCCKEFKAHINLGQQENKSTANLDFSFLAPQSSAYTLLPSTPEDIKEYVQADNSLIIPRKRYLLFGQIIFYG